MAKVEVKTFDSRFWKIFIPFLFFIGLILFFPYWFTQMSWVEFDFKDSGEIGDTIGGVLGPFIAIGAAILTFFAFWVQLKANEQQRQDIALERFETKFYEMLRLHRSNVEEMEIAGKHRGRKAFVEMFKEFRFIYQVLDKKTNADHSHEWSSNIAFHHFFYGVDDSMESVSSDKKLQVYEKDTLKFLKMMKSNARIQFNQGKRPAVLILQEGIRHDTDFFPFGGHASRLGHYFRHLYQTVKFVASYDKVELSFNDRYEYIKLLRAQLSNHEQLLIYYNTFSPHKVWWDDELGLKNEEGLPLSYFLDFKLIKNIPFNLTKRIGLDPFTAFKNRIIHRYEDAGQSILQNEAELKAKTCFEWKERELTKNDINQQTI
ncbi:putative phage abortive infection protein [Reichenbachiella ulvae]|uniref:Phage abortive infection protein n=1 Tax=Reichenbachiella ulvae TaxID=2980104 RepID=A0ABT3D006_9BACT|nr:putative phage abortive infection protein [Reichenbachiella ulvae]MCV9389144.1 putative phage abortive infection protein [Reichenbachiella ulvae]